MSEPHHKDFLALTHGEEWVTFYESFDKLVQDNLSRSSDLLKRAMALPEVADREVAKIKGELEAELAEERSRQRSVLADLRDEVTGSHRQISILTQSMGGVVGNLERLSGRITAALAAVESTPQARMNAPADAAAAPPANQAPEPAPAPAPPPAPEAAATVPMAAAEADPAIDLNALAQAEASVPAALAEEPAGATNGSSGDRQRPAWLSVARMGIPGNN